MPTIVHYESADGVYRGISCHDILAVCPTRAQTVDGQREANSWASALMKKHPAGIGLLINIPGTLPPPSDAVRREISSALREWGKDIRGVVHVIEGSGFRLAAIRSIIIAVNVVSLPCPNTVESTLDAGVRWLFQKLPADAARGSVSETFAALDQTFKSALQPGPA